MRNKGITLIALIITIIVMLILVGVTVTVAINGGLFGTADEAAKGTKYEQDKEILQAGILGAINTETLEIPSAQELDNNLPEPWTVDGTGPYTATSPNNNVFTVDIKGNIAGKEENPGSSTGDLALLEKYFLGEDRKGRNIMEEVMDEGLTKFKPYDIMPEFHEEELEYLTYQAEYINNEQDKNYNIRNYYVKYKGVGYKVITQDDLSSNGYEYMTKNIEKIYEQKGREGRDLGEVTGDPQYNGWTILYDNGNEVEAVAPDVVGEKLALGEDDKTAQTPGDIDENGIENTDLDKSIYSYNNVIKTINDYCKNLPGLPTNNGVRSIGAEIDPISNLEGNNAYNKIPTGWSNSKYNGKAKVGDSSYEQDIIRMSYYKKLNINKDYWCASRVASGGTGGVSFGVWFIRHDDCVRKEILWFVRSEGVPYSYNPSYGVRPIIKVSNI